MLLRDSRYVGSRGFEADPLTGAAFDGLRPRAIGPSTPVLEHLICAGDRLDLLARHYYGDDRLWWRIVDANPAFLLGDDLVSGAMEGQTILIPRAAE